MLTDRDDDLLRRHLLGELPEEESARLEERLLAEDDLFELAEAVEADLLADAAGPGPQRPAVARLAATERGRRAAILGRDLATTAASTAPATAAAAPGEAGPVVFFPARRPAVRLALRLALAAGLTAAVLGVGAWLVIEEQARRDEGRALRAEQQEIERSEPRENALRRLDRRRRPGERIATGPNAEQPETRNGPDGQTPMHRMEQTPQSTARVEATLLLSLATLRSGAAAPRIVLPPIAERLLVQVDLGLTADEPSPYLTYAAVLRSAAGAEVWRAEGLAPAPDGTLRLPIPASRLMPGRYELAVQGMTASGEVEDLGFPELEVTRP